MKLTSLYRRRAIVAPVAGTTRDSLARPTEWRGAAFELFDTGGMFGASDDPLHELVIRHGRHAIDAADLLVFVVDGREGLVPGDERIAREDRRRLVEFDVGSGASAPQIVVVHRRQIVVNQRICVNHLDRARRAQ